MKSPALVGLLAQLGFVLSVGFALLLVSTVVAYSYALGALVYILPNTYFTHYAFRYRGARNAHSIFKSFSWGESGKFALVIVGFAMIFRLVDPLSVGAVFTGFCSMIILQWRLASFLGRRWL